MSGPATAGMLALLADFGQKRFQRGYGFMTAEFAERFLEPSAGCGFFLWHGGDDGAECGGVIDCGSAGRKFTQPVFNIADLNWKIVEITEYGLDFFQIFEYSGYFAAGEFRTEEVQ